MFSCYKMPEWYGGISLKFTENQLKAYAAPLSDTENQQCLNAIGMVRDALKKLGLTDDGKAISSLYPDTYAYSLEMKSLYSNRQVKIFIQGSYANNTNVRTESDVDIAIVQEEVFTPEYRVGVYGQNYGFTDAPLSPKSFKDEVQECLEYKFGNDVERRNKSIKIHGNTYRKDADSIPCRRYRDYRFDFSFDENNYVGGIVIHTDNGQQIINYPEQHIANGKNKNNNTNYYYKKMVRIMKKIRYIMNDNAYSSSEEVSSFGLESLLWNIPDEIFMKYTTYRFVFDDLIEYLVNNIYSLSSYKEANGIKQLCPNQTIVSNYQKFINDLKNFYTYDINE